MHRSLPAIFLLTALFACGDDSSSTDAGGDTFDAASTDATSYDATPPDASPPDATPDPTCTGPFDPGANHTQYVADSITVPTTASLANQLGINLDADDQGRPDNALGQILSALSSQGNLDFQVAVDTLVDGGDLLYMFDVDAVSLVDEANATVLHVLGEDCDFNPSNNFSGDEPFTVADPSNESALTGTIGSGALDIGPGEMTLRMVVFTADPIDLPLIGARIHGTIDANGIMTGKIGGAILESEVENTLIPGLADSMQAVIDVDCMGTSPTCCTDGTTGQTYVDLFDENSDCMVTAMELRDSSLISSLFAPDVDLLDSTNGDIFDPRVDGIKDSLSLGIGFTAVGAQFERPTPMQ
jgi:hypothetical protein